MPKRAATKCVCPIAETTRTGQDHRHRAAHRNQKVEKQKTPNETGDIVQLTLKQNSLAFMTLRTSKEEEKRRNRLGLSRWKRTKRNHGPGISPPNRLR